MGRVDVQSEDEVVQHEEDGQGGEVDVQDEDEVVQGNDLVGQDDWEHAQHINQHLYFQSSDEEDDMVEEQGLQIMHHIIFLSSDEEDEVEQDNDLGLDAFEEGQDNDLGLDAFEEDQVDQNHGQVLLTF